MSVADDFCAFTALVTASLDNATAMVETFHQSAAELTLGVVSECGFPSGVATVLADKHRNLLAMTYGLIRSTNHDLGDLMVRQMGEISAFADEIGVPLPDSPAATVLELTQVLSRRPAQR